MVSNSFNFNSAQFELVNEHTLSVTTANGSSFEYDFKKFEIRSEGKAPVPFEKADAEALTIMRTQMIALGGNPSPASTGFVSRDNWNPQTGC